MRIFVSCVDLCTDLKALCTHIVGQIYCVACSYPIISFASPTPPPPFAVFLRLSSVDLLPTLAWLRRRWQLHRISRQVNSVGGRERPLRGRSIQGFRSDGGGAAGEEGDAGRVSEEGGTADRPSQPAVQPQGVRRGPIPDGPSQLLHPRLVTYQDPQPTGIFHHQLPFTVR